MIVGPLTVTLEREEVVDFTIPYYDFAGIQIMMKKPAVDRSMFKFTYVFDGYVWLAIAGVLVGVSLLLYLLDKLSIQGGLKQKDQENKKMTLKQVTWFVMGTFTMAGEWVIHLSRCSCSASGALIILSLV